MMRAAPSAAPSPPRAAARLEPAKVDALLQRARREVDDGLLPSCQLAVALDGEVVVNAAFGPATVDTRYVAFSSTKALVAAAIWRLLADGRVELGRPAADYVPAFGTNGKDVVTVEQLLLHTGGFPFAPLGPPEWATREGRLKRFAAWRLTLEPGTTYRYHPTAGHWVLAEIIESVTGTPYPDAIEALVTAPLGLPRLLGVSPDGPNDVAPLSGVGEPPTPEEMEAAMGVAIDLTAVFPPDVALGALLTLAGPEAQALGVPGGGGVMRAQDLARFYQGLLHDPVGLWPPDLLLDVTRRVRCSLPDLMGVPANRSLGLLVAGDDGRSHLRGFGRTVSPQAFGHNGAGGQVAWADPATGLSFVYFTNGLDQHLIREQRRCTALSSLAATLTTA
jgi:CubicO group peptidase (beta-lactamase class C family)